MRISTYHQVGPLVKRKRLERGLTQAYLAQESGVSRRLLNDLESGKAPNIGLERLLAILEILDVPLCIGEEPVVGEVPDYIKDLENKILAAANPKWDIFERKGRAHRG